MQDTESDDAAHAWLVLKQWMIVALGAALVGTASLAWFDSVRFYGLGCMIFGAAVANIYRCVCIINEETQTF